jgi:hypothetical protein
VTAFGLGFSSPNGGTPQWVRLSEWLGFTRAVLQAGRTKLRCDVVAPVVSLNGNPLVLRESLIGKGHKALNKSSVLSDQVSDPLARQKVVLSRDALLPVERRY